MLTELRELLYVRRGNATDFAFIEREILDLAGPFDIREIGYDRTFAGEIVTNLQDKGLELIQFGQGFLSLAAPTAELERLVISRALGIAGIRCCAGTHPTSQFGRILPGASNRIENGPASASTGYRR